jgi:predicted dithiol-disulfide oxidoreductase (DUF899 family)
MTGSLENHKVVSRSEWLKARKIPLNKEKEFTVLRDQLSQERQNLPWTAVDKEYVFEGPNGEETLSELFDGRSQLIVYHFMFDPSWDAACLHCSFWADNFNGIIVHLNQRDVTMVAVSKAPYNKLADYNVSFRPEEVAKKEGMYNFTIQDPLSTEREGVSIFYKDPTGHIFHTYSAYARGIDMLNVAYHYLDLVPKGRDEAGHEFPQFWVRRHDEYEKQG